MTEVCTANNQPLKSFLCSWVPQTWASLLLFFWQNHVPVRKKRSRSEMPSELTQEQTHSEMVTTLHHSLLLSCQTQEKMEVGTCSPLRALTVTPCSWCTSDRHQAEFQHSPPVPLHSIKPLPFQGAFKPKLF